VGKVTDRLVLGGYKSVSAVARHVPSSASHTAAHLLARGATPFLKERRAVVARNLRRADPTLSGTELDRAVQAAFDSYARYWVDSFRVPGLSAAEIQATFTIDGEDHLRASQERGKGSIIALPHLGGWEWAGRWVADQGWQITVVVEPLQPPELYDWFVGFRTSLGMNVVPLGPDAGSIVAKALRDNHVVCLLCDRDLQRNGVQVEFFDEKTTLPPGPAFLALRTGAALMPTAVYFTPERDGHAAIIRPPLAPPKTGSFRDDVAALTQDLASELEWLIRRAPEQWHLFQPNWPSDPGYEA
jgi:phosphatidylinositol dimannoside acyltransferase